MKVLTFWTIAATASGTRNPQADMAVTQRPYKIPTKSGAKSSKQYMNPPEIATFRIFVLLSKIVFKFRIMIPSLIAFARVSRAMTRYLFWAGSSWLTLNNIIAGRIVPIECHIFLKTVSGKHFLLRVTSKTGPKLSKMMKDMAEGSAEKIPFFFTYN